VQPSVPIVSHIGSVLASRETIDETADGKHRRWHTRLSAWNADRLEAKSYAEDAWLHLVSTPMVAKVRESAHRLPPGFFHVCPLGSSVRRFDRTAAYPDLRIALEIPSTATVLISVARLVRWKNIELVIRALASLVQAETYLIVVGDGPDATRLRELSLSLGLQEYIRFVGHIGDPAPYYAASDIFVLPSAIESFGNVYAEAMLMGLPCIGLKHAPPDVLSAAEDVIPESVAGFCISNLAELVSRIELLIKDVSLRHTLSENAYEHAVNNYTIESYSKEIIRLVHLNFRI
jgi:glycosyltransferase involved in cell wall biosynthesis